MRWAETYLNLDQITCIMLQREALAGFRVATVSLAGGGSLTVQLVDEDWTPGDALEAIEKLSRGERAVR